MVKNVDIKNFQNEVINSKRPVLVDFFANWCSPCKMLAPVVDEVSDELEKVIDVAKVDIDTDAEIADYYAVSSVPTMILFRKGEELVRFSGVMPKDSLMGTVLEYLNE